LPMLRTFYNKLTCVWWEALNVYYPTCMTLPVCDVIGEMSLLRDMAESEHFCCTFYY